MSLEILVTAQRLAAETPEPGFPTNRLRFSLEYTEAPDIEEERAKLVELLGGDKFDLRPFDELLPEFLVLQFPGVERRVSPETQFTAGDALVDALGLVSAVPDLLARYVAEPAGPDQLEGAVGEAILKFTCWVDEDTALQKDWAVRAVRAPEVWADGITGSGVLVAQPDSGVADHGELAGVLDLARAANTLDGSSDPTDPLSSSMANPGHGTATASVVASRGTGQIFGSAPGAKVAPIRCLDAVVLGLDPTPVAKAITHAVSINADVISMSLGGGFHSPVMARALKTAADAGIISIAAAGNCVQPIVVYPARDRNVVGLAGTNARDGKWKGTSRGRSVALSAPAENVWVARRTPTDGGVATAQPSQGTSFAAATTAGVAAMWVEKWGRTKIRHEAERLNTTVGNLFRFCAQHTARTPNSWPRGMGPGIVDAKALMALDPEHVQLPGGTPEAAPATDDMLALTLDRAYDDIELGMDEWPRIGAEAVFALNAVWTRENRSNSYRPESAQHVRLSDGTQDRLPPDFREVLDAVPRKELAVPQPLPIPSQLDYAKIIAATSSSVTESSNALSPGEAQYILQSDRANEIVANVRSALGRIDARQTGDRDARAEVANTLHAVIDDLAAGDVSQFDTARRASLEAIVRLTGRPAHPLTDGNLSAEDIQTDTQWGGFLGMLVDLPSWANSVGRINLDGYHIGTGFQAGNGVMTNRHVLESLIDEVVGPGGTEWGFDRGRVTVDFSDTGDGSAEFGLDHVIMAGADPIRFLENLSRLDMAMLGYADNAGPTNRPALKLAKDLEPNKNVAVIGFPASPTNDAFIDPVTGLPNHEIGKRLRAIFGTDFGRKYVAPGLVMSKPGELPGDDNSWVFSHDCTTLGGNSGSVVVQFGATPAVSGLHFSGAPLIANKAHALGRVQDVTQGAIPNATWV